MLLAAAVAARGGGAYDSASEAGTCDNEGRIITQLRVVIEGSPRDEAAEAELLSLLSVTEQGRRLIDSIVDLRGAWLARAIELNVTEDEREVLARAAENMLRVADSRLEQASDEAWRM